VPREKDAIGNRKGLYIGADSRVRISILSNKKHG
jgi:hypothetical protein